MERWITDDAGSLIDIVNREYYDYMEDITPILNNYEKRIQKLEKLLETLTPLKFEGE